MKNWENYLISILWSLNTKKCGTDHAESILIISEVIADGLIKNFAKKCQATISPKIHILTHKKIEKIT